MVRITVKVNGCNGCDLTLAQFRPDAHTWQSKTKRVVDGKVSFFVARSHTKGLTMAVTPPWERRAEIPTGYQTMAVFRYQGVAPGSSIWLKAARGKRKGSPCWAGTTKAAHTIPLTVRKVRVQGTTGPTDGTIAWVNPQARNSRSTMASVHRGIYGAQDGVICQSA